MYKKDKDKPKSVEQMVETEANFIIQALLVKLKCGEEEREEVFTKKFVGVPIDFKISMHFPGAKVLSEKALSKDEVKTLLAAAMKGKLVFY